MNKKEKENVKEAEEEEEEEGIWAREQRKRKRKRKRSRRRRRREEQLADRLDLAPASDGGQRAEVKGQTSVIFLFFSTAGMLEPRQSRVKAVSAPCRRSEKKEKKKRETLAGHRNQVSHTSTGVRHVSDTDTMPKMACPCNLGYMYKRLQDFYFYLFYFTSSSSHRFKISGTKLNNIVEILWVILDGKLGKAFVHLR